MLSKVVLTRRGLTFTSTFTLWKTNKEKMDCLSALFSVDTSVFGREKEDVNDGILLNSLH